VFAPKKTYDSSEPMDNSRTPARGLMKGISGVLILVLGIVALYYLYSYLYASDSVTSKRLISTAIRADTTHPPLQMIPPMYEGGEYSVSFWVYITGFKDQVGKNKHILEIRGSQFSTLAVGLGSFTNKLVVRVHTSGANSSKLTPANVKKLFTSQDSGLLSDSLPLCDLPEVDLQRWVCITIVLNGRTSDVYMDGKLARSCVLPSFFKVDRTVRMKMLDFGGFSGFLGDVVCYSGALNPEEVYRIYMSGPTDSGSSGFVDWLKNMFDLRGTLSYKVPVPAIRREKGSVTF
jgi:Concanavalin A-like lectin/glucanases superfamily